MSFDHELTMVLHDDDGMVVVTGCSHSGVLNMIDAALERFPDRRLRAVVGGFHLIGLPSADSMALSRAEVEDIGRELRALCDGPVFTGHCTGHTAFGVLGRRSRRSTPPSLDRYHHRTLTGIGCAICVVDAPTDAARFGTYPSTADSERESSRASTWPMQLRTNYDRCS